MGKRKVKEFREMGIKELEEKISSMKDELTKEKAQISSGTRAENPGKIKKIRRDIARVLTLINEKEKEKEEKKTKERKQKKKIKQKKTKKKQKSNKKIDKKKRKS